MILDRVTITGADDSILPVDLLPLSKEFGFVEWGILLSKKKAGDPRFPSYEWMTELARLTLGGEIKFSGHLCGRWVRDLVLDGLHSFLNEQPGIEQMFQRFQLNFHAEPHEKVHNSFFYWLGLDQRQYIFQLDGVNHHLFQMACDVRPELDIAPLFDKSGGIGVTPREWPEAFQGVYNGYAGGLGPDNLEVEIQRIAKVARGEQVWIDMETKVRSEDDKQFDLEKVRRCLEIAAPFVKGR